MTHPFDLFRYTPYATCLTRVDDGTVIQVNDAYLTLFELTRADIIGRTPSSAGITVDNDQAGLDRVELQVVTSKGVRTMEVSSRAVDVEGSSCALSSFNDITAQRRAEADAGVRDANMRDLAEIIPDAFWIATPDNARMLYVSPAYERIFGRTCAHLYEDALDWQNAVHPEDKPRMAAFAADLALALRQGEQRTEYRVIKPGGAIRNIQIKVFPVRDEAGAVIRMAGVAEDVTERKALEAQVRETQKLESLGLLAGGIAHDFNNILAVIASNASFLIETQSEGPLDRELVDEIDHAVQRATALTRQLLAFSRRETIEPVVLDLNAAVNDTRKMLRRMVGEDVVITTSLEPELGRVRIDPGYLVQVLMNLSVNARDAMPRGGTLTITTRNREPEHEVVLSVADTGSGMTPEVKARVFEPLFTTKGQGKGTGLGLSVVRGIIDQAGGRVEIESEVDAGTTLRIYLPLETAPADVVANMPTAGSQGSEKLVVVDDDPHVRQSISRALRGRGYVVLEASDGRAALELLHAHGKEVALLVTDVVMPVMDGRQLVETARARRPSLPVLYITGYTDDAVLRHGVERAEVAVLEKPFRGHVLAERVRQVLDVEK